MSSNIPIRINGKNYTVPPNITILEACRDAGIYIPSLCYHSDLMPAGICGLCIVKTDGSGYCYSCMTTVTPNMQIDTVSDDVLKKEREALQLFNGNSKFPPGKDVEEVMDYLYPQRSIRVRHETKTASIHYKPDECINCYRCVRMCSDLLDIGAIDDIELTISPTTCIECGLCSTVCPTKAITETRSSSQILQALATGKKLCLIIDPSIITSFGELFDIDSGADVTSKLISAARSVGFSYVFDNRFGVDLVAYDTAQELLGTNVHPLITTNCPSVVTFIERNHTNLLENLSPLKTPESVLSLVLKKRFNSPYIVYLTGCSASKAEAREDQCLIDSSITAREFAKFLKSFDISFDSLKPSQFDGFGSESSKSASLYPLAGGFSAAIFSHLGADLSTKLPIKSVYEDTISIKQKGDIKICVVNGIGNFSNLDFKKYDYIEILACPGGCIAGGGQPKLSSRKLVQPRIDGLLKISMNRPIEPIALNNFKHELATQEGSHLHSMFYAEYRPSTEEKPPRKFTNQPIVVYGSSQGHATRLARQTATFMKAPSMPMYKLSFEEMHDRKTIIFITSTVGQGNSPPNAASFVSRLEECKEDLSSIKFCVLGIGRNEMGDNFCKTAVRIRQAMLNRNAQEIIPMIKLDNEKQSQFEKLFSQWTEALSNVFFLKDVKIGKELCNQIIQDTATPMIQNVRPNGFEYAKMVEKELLSNPGEAPAVNRYSFELPLGVSYELGDYICILPKNEPVAVDSVLKALKYDAGVTYTIKSRDNQMIPQKISIGQLFSQFLDLAAPPPSSLIKAFEEAMDADGKKKLAEYTKTNTERFIVDFAPFGAPPLDMIISSITHTVPRYYSIISPPDMKPGFLDIMVMDVYYGENHGLCTNYLHNCLGEDVAIHTEVGKFKYPKNIMTPIILVGLGSGFAPMLALIMYRMQLLSEGKKIGPCIAFFAAKNKGKFPLLINKLNMFKEKKSLDDVFFAFSRDDDTPKMHIQDLMRKQKDKLWEFWMEPETEFFYCGPEKVSKELQEIMINITVKEGWMALEEAMSYSNRHEWHA